MEDLAGWIGRAREVEDELTAPAMRRLAALLDREAVPLARGEAVLPHWIAVLFDDAAPQSRLGPDGAALKGEFLPPVPLPRRMLAGRRIRYAAPPRIGDALVRRSEIAAITPKQGRSGRLVFVTVRHTIRGPAGVVAVEEQDIVYREAATASGGRPAGPGGDRAEPWPAAAWQEEFRTDPVLLFRYSALGFNGHRIHYDLAYAREIEGYPGLVVNGGLSTLMLIEAGLRRAGAAMLRRYAARTLRPLICGRPARLLGTAPDAHGAALLWVEDESGAPALRLEVEYAA
ncbi:MaoC family dehydratase N-terminal domain-containing protein [Caldovatus sp. SYSU G05006]|uniref:MaoC family dehydratase N-terminal domain-containing protein n=1 Tax=Caldovatus aquaticus TaxID=2865671 RepID=A0ABS7F006_9PROT|nr:MaoC family dehydratase N-terminal domain-containing protein [Caldovatus aquaticus]